MPCLRMNNERLYVFGENEFLRKLPVKQEEEAVPGMIPADTLHRLMREPADAFEPVFQKKAGIDGYVQWYQIFRLEPAEALSRLRVSSSRLGAA